MSAQKTSMNDFEEFKISYEEEVRETDFSFTSVV